MNKQKLPKNWIVLNSKSHPDRVYYFNVKTNQSSWNDPTTENIEEIATKPKETNKKRKRADEECISLATEPTTPEYEVPDNGNSKQKKKLVAKRSLRQTEEKNKGEKETPQMRILREKIQRKEEQNKASQSSKNLKAVNKVGVTPKSPEKNKMTTQHNANGKKECYTPQMQAIFAKMQARASISTPNEKKEPDDKVKDKKEELHKLRRPRSQYVSRKSIIPDSLDSSETVENEGNQLSTSSLVSQNRRSMVKKKSDDSILNDNVVQKRGRRSVRKNLGKERLETLRRSLNSKSDACESDNTDNLSKSTNSSTSASRKEDVLPIIYKNAEVRLVRLKHRLLKDKISSNKSLEGDETAGPEKPSHQTVTTVDDLVKQSYNNNFCEEMDWEPMEDEKITFEIQAIRTQLSTESHAGQTSSVPSNILKYPLPSEQQEKRQLYIVADTNVFLSDIQTIEVAKDTTFKTYDRPIIVVPWTVIRELDYIKDNKSKTKSTVLCAKARKAVHYLHQLFSSRDPHIIGQTPEDVKKNKEIFAIDCPDDEILQTCLQLRDLGKSVVLLSYDKNLCNKAMIYDIVTLGRNDPFEKIDYLNVSSKAKDLLFDESQRKHDVELTSILNQELYMSNEIFEDVKNVMKDFFTVIVSKEMHELYGESWDKHVIIRPPWTAVTVLQCAVKHWIAAISESFYRKAEDILKKLLKLFEAYPEGGRRLNEVSYILEKCSDLIQMVNIDKHPNLMLRTSQKIDELKRKCRECEIQINEKKLRDAIGTEDNIIEQDSRAKKAFQYFEAIYVYARDMCGLATKMVGMPCSFHYEIPNPLPSQAYVKKIQPELAANVNRLLHTLSSVIEQVENSGLDRRTLTSLYQILVTFLPESALASVDLVNDDMVPLDVYCCVKQKKDVLKIGLRQLQELSTDLSRLASFRSP